MKRILSMAKNKYYHNPIRSNLFMVFLALFVVVTLPSLLLLNLYNRNQNDTQLLTMSDNNQLLLYRNMAQIIDGAKKISTSILSNDMAQSVMKHASNPADNIISAENTLYNLCSTSPSRLSAYLYDFTGNCYRYDSSGTKHIIGDSIYELSVYQQALALDGKTFCANTGNIFSNASGLSIIRIFKDINSLENKGILIVNIPSDTANSGSSDHAFR